MTLDPGFSKTEDTVKSLSVCYDTLEIIYELRVEIISKSKFKELTNIIERVKRLFAPDNNSDYSPSGTYKWHDGRITSIDYSRDEDSPEILRAILTFQCLSLEAT